MAPEQKSTKPKDKSKREHKSSKTETTEKPKSDKTERSEEHKSKHAPKRKREAAIQGEEEAQQRHKSKKHRKHGTATDTATTHDTSINSPFHTQTTSLYLPLSPISQATPLEGLCAEHLSPLLLTYYPPFSGVLLSYTNPRISERPFHSDGDETLLQCIDEYGVSYCWLTADFLLFKPQIGCEIEGFVNLQNEEHLGVVCWNLFNASIRRNRLPAEWTWVSVESAEGGGEYENYAEGHFADGDGKKLDGMVKFRVKDIESSADRERGFLSIEGTMLSPEAEGKLVQEEMASAKKHVLGSGTRTGGRRALGATHLGAPREEDAAEDMEDGTRRRKGRY